MNRFAKKLSQNPLRVLFFTGFLNMVRFGILIPVIPELLANPHSPYFLLPAGFSLKSGYILFGLPPASVF